MPVKKLHVAKSLKDLELLTAVQKALISKPTNILVTSAEKVFKNGQEKFLDSDEETAYVQYVRFIELVLELNKRTDFDKHEKKNRILQNANTAISKAETLKESLLRRYSLLESASKENGVQMILPTISKSTPEVIEEEDISDAPPQKPENEEQLSISSSDLHSLLKDFSSSILIMDTRPEKDFADSHIKYSRCISVPQEILKPGLTAAKLESSLPKDSFANWLKRAEADYIVLIDWESENETTQNVHLNALKTAMAKWDQKCVLKKMPMVLKGGYKDWMRKYPMLTTKALDFDLMSNVKLSPVVADLSGIEYPNLDESLNEVQILNEINSSDRLFKKSPMPKKILNDISPTSIYPDNRKSYSAPAVDRKSKPSIDLPNKTLSNDVKPVRSLSSSGNNKRSTNTPTEKPVPPAVDRKLKGTVINSVTDNKKEEDNSILESFNKEQNLKKESVEIANQKLKNEEEFEKLCLRKELEAEESKRIEIQKNEEFLIQKLKNLQIEIEEKDAEYLKVQEENKKYKQFFSNIDKEYRKEKEKDMNKALEKQALLRENVEKLREERKRKEAENKKKEIHTSVPRESVSANSALRRTDNNADKSLPSEYTMPLSRQSSDSSGRGGLVRSHSSPNIAQMLNEEECFEHKTPSVDRTLKPKVNVNTHFGEINRARLRNLNPLYGNCQVRPATGLRNLGNTCFMNSVIQCLSNTLPLADYINSDKYVEHISRENKQGTCGELLEEFAVVIKALWMGQYKSFYPRDFKNTVSKCLAVCIGNEQQDSHEFLVVLMEKLHSDLNKKHMKNIPKLDSNCNENTFWQHHKNYNSSKISDIFDGLLKSTLTCLSCRKTSDSFEVFSCLSLPILTSKCTLRECFQHFLRAEKISGEAAWDCPRCKQKKEAEKKLRICRTPEILIIQLKRFSYEGLWRRKLQTHVDFDFSLEVPYESNSRESQRFYSLYGIVNHYGTLEGGHYTAYCKTNTGKWFKYDDHEVCEMSSSDIKTSAAYLLFYIASDFQSRL